MLERECAQEFDATFKNFQLWKPNNRQAGWPDRAIQLHYSVLVWIELKVTTIRTDSRILLSNFDKDQAAFMYKWQRQGGYCFLLAALLDRQEHLMGYIVIKPLFYKDWTTVNRQLYTLDYVELYTESMDKVLLWFRSVYIRQDRYIERDVNDPIKSRVSTKV